MKYLLILLGACFIALICIAFFIWNRFKIRKVYDRKRDRDTHL